MIYANGLITFTMIIVYSETGSQCRTFSTLRTIVKQEAKPDGDLIIKMINTIHRWLEGSYTIMYDSSLCTLIHQLMAQVFIQFVAGYKRLDATIVSINYHKTAGYIYQIHQLKSDFPHDSTPGSRNTELESYVKNDMTSETLSWVRLLVLKQKQQSMHHDPEMVFSKLTGSHLNTENQLLNMSKKLLLHLLNIHLLISKSSQGVLMDSYKSHSTAEE